METILLAGNDMSKRKKYCSNYHPYFLLENYGWNQL